MLKYSLTKATQYEYLVQLRQQGSMPQKWPQNLLRDGVKIVVRETKGIIEWMLNN